MMPQELTDTRLVKTPPDERLVESPSDSNWDRVTAEELAELAATYEEFGMPDAV